MTGPLVLKNNPAEDLEAVTKQYVDNHTSDVVLYTPQSLTDGQKTQARGNIGAAPDGFGLGKSAYSLLKVSPANIDACTAAGWYYYYDSAYGSLAGLAFSGGIFVIPSFTDTLQYFFPRSSKPNPGTYAVRKLAGDTWTEWEINNPPMTLGVEYRTTERYLGKPVYVKLIDCGNLPNGTTKEVAHGITNLDFMVGAQAIASNSTSGFNGHTYLPEIYNGSLTDRWTDYLAGIDTKNIRIFCGGGLAGCLVYVTFKYTKTTD